jgi:hypothetical protein
MRRLSLEACLTTSLTVVFAGAFFLTMGFPFEAAVFPRLISGVALLLCLGAQLRATFRKGDPGRNPSEDGGERRAQAITTLWIVAFFAGSALLGFLIGLPLMILLHYLVEARLPLWRAAIGGGAALAFLLVMKTQLNLPLFGGLLF